MTITFKTLLCRIAFVLLVAVPTCCTITWVAIAAMRPLELAPEAWSDLLSEKTGLEIRIGKMERMANGVFLLERFELADPESNEIWISAPRVEAKLDAKGYSMAATGATVKASSLRRLSEHFQHRLLRCRAEDFLSLTLRMTKSQLLLSGGEPAQLELSEVRLTTQLVEKAPALEIQAKLIEEGEEVRATLWASRHRERGEARTEWEWEIAGREGISATTLAEFSPSWRVLGPLAKFRGAMFDAGGEENHFVLSGVQIRDIDLSILSEAMGVERLSGMASLTGAATHDLPEGARCQVRNGKFTDLAGECFIQAGSIDQELLRRVASAMQWQLHTNPAVTGEVAFDELAVGIELFGDKLKVRGLVDGGLTGNSDGVMRRKEAMIVRQQFRGYRSAHDVFGVVLGEVRSGSLPTSQLMAAIPEPRGAASTRMASKKGNLK